jgi:hypothetical protein
MLLLLYQKRKGLRLLTFFDVKESVVVLEDGICVCDLARKSEPVAVTIINLKSPSFFPTSNATEYVIRVYQTFFIFFLNNVAGRVNQPSTLQ